jgi:hypothetical protein
LDKHVSPNQYALGAQLGENVGRLVVVAANMVELDTFKVDFKLAYLDTLCIHAVFLDVTGLIDLVDDEVGVTVIYDAFDPQGDNNVQPMDEGFILSIVVGRFVMDLQDVLQVVAFGRDKQHAFSHSFKVQGTIKVHLSVLRFLQWWGLLGLCPLKNEVVGDSHEGPLNHQGKPAYIRKKTKHKRT